MLRPPGSNNDNDVSDELSYYYSRCSICFDRRFEICLRFCHDQFCTSCFNKYVSQVVSSSWGLSVTIVKCPVCQQEIPKQEWSMYVPNHVLQSYNKFNQPFQKYKTNCCECQTELIPCANPQPNQPNSPSLIYDLIKNTLDSCNEKDHMNHKDHIALKRWIPILKRHKWDNKANQLDFYHQIMSDLIRFSKNHLDCNDDSARQISLEFVFFLTTPELWKKIQLAHIKYFPNMTCINCDFSVCVLCGNKAHTNSCQSNMKMLLETENINGPTKRTLEWKLSHCRQCPGCSIMISREEGCNKVDCPFCGSSFCWECQSSWSKGCAFYRCSLVSSGSSSSSISFEEKTELGVPDMNRIEERYSRR